MPPVNSVLSFTSPVFCRLFYLPFYFPASGYCGLHGGGQVCPRELRDARAEGRTGDWRMVPEQAVIGAPAALGRAAGWQVCRGGAETGAPAATGRPAGWQVFRGGAVIGAPAATGRPEGGRGFRGGGGGGASAA